jgi:hypothetical protein
VFTTHRERFLSSRAERRDMKGNGSWVAQTKDLGYLCGSFCKGNILDVNI